MLIEFLGEFTISFFFNFEVTIPDQEHVHDFECIDRKTYTIFFIITLVGPVMQEFLLCETNKHNVACLGSVRRNWVRMFLERNYRCCKRFFLEGIGNETWYFNMAV